MSRSHLFACLALIWLVAWPAIWFSIPPKGNTVTVLEVPAVEPPVTLPSPPPEIIYIPMPPKPEPEVIVSAGPPQREPAREAKPKPAAVTEKASDAKRAAPRPGGTRLDSVRLAEGETLTLPAGTVRVGGDWDVSGTVEGADSRLIFDGDNQLIRGDTELTNAVFSGGTKRIQGRLRVGRGSGRARPGEAHFIVEQGTTLVVEQGSHVRADGRHGYQVAGELVLDGGTFSGSFAHGDGERWSESWLPGSKLTVNGGRFVGTGDHNFSGAEITMHSGAILINDDIWHSGEKLTMYGGVFRNSTRGGWFWLNGEVNLYGGSLRAYQHRTRGLGIHADANVLATNAIVEIRGRDATSNNSGIHLHGSATFNHMNIRVNTIIHRGSLHTAWLSVASMRIWNRKRFEARGHHLAINLAPNSRGEYIP